MVDPDHIAHGDAGCQVARDVPAQAQIAEENAQAVINSLARPGL